MYLYAYLNLLHPPVATPFPSPALAARALPSSHPPMACFSSSIFAPFPTCTRLYFKPSTGNLPPRPTRIRIRSSQADGNDLDSIEKFPKGLSESTVRSISALKAEPNWMLRFRLAALEGLRSMAEPKWSDNFSPPIDLDSVCYFSKPKLNIPETLRKLDITLREEECLAKANVALDAFIDATSIATTYRGTLLKAGIIFCSISETIREYPDLVR